MNLNYHKMPDNFNYGILYSLYMFRVDTVALCAPVRFLVELRDTHTVYTYTYIRRDLSPL